VAQELHTDEDHLHDIVTQPWDRIEFGNRNGMEYIDGGEVDYGCNIHNDMGWR